MAATRLPWPMAAAEEGAMAKQRRVEGVLD